VSAQTTRYEALLKMCDMACAHASATGADQRPEFFETMAAALEDDCPNQARAALLTASSLRRAIQDREQLLSLLHTTP
jgi:hypothetical protein